MYILCILLVGGAEPVPDPFLMPLDSTLYWQKRSRLSNMIKNQRTMKGIELTTFDTKEKELKDLMMKLDVMLEDKEKLYEQLNIGGYKMYETAKKVHTHTHAFNATYQQSN